ncbi:hypothetical protein [Lentzea flava]|uniref:Uncharacterized protein n=1 Tax=Lentzea flava TaxID=103732 RepID=A0ABQ2UIU3_9PSEU|nr:hypothetical protein [Lentzea flava]MCP2199648.1 hypothetical protein [Lentzea flava]GGU39282.1 hypothetical protein GCM10010178_34620 [Lentzea flava]
MFPAHAGSPCGRKDADRLLGDVLSEHAIKLVEISLTAAEARSRAVVVTSWLLDRGVITPNTARDEVMAPSEFRAGPRCAEASPEAERWVGGGHTGVDVLTQRTVHHATGNYEPPTCPHCGFPAISEEDHHALIEPWLYDRVEASVRCVACGRCVLAGDLEGQWSFHIGDLAVVFHNWPPLADGFVAELGAVMGPRTRVVVEHL